MLNGGNVVLNNGWKLKCGKYVDSYVSETQVWDLFDNFFSTGSTKNTAYKFIFMKSIVEIVSELQVNETINYYDIFEKFTEIYWDLYVKQGLRQSRKSQKATAEKIIDMYSGNERQSSTFSNLHSDIKSKLVTEIQLECKKNVIGAVYADFNGYIYSFSNDKSEIELNEIFFNFIKKYKSILLKLNYLEWMKYMVKVNESININQFCYFSH